MTNTFFHSERHWKAARAKCFVVGRRLLKLVHQRSMWSYVN